ncbi:MAG: TrkH family potassium uptake protein [Lachnospiraceae bacterium]|nr:TrkH family potassium uptake protein [Lachnospiraceae bacterium]
MNFAIVRYILGFILQFEGFFLILPAIVGLLYQETKDALIYFGVAILCIATGHLTIRKKPANTRLFTREGFTSVALGWVVLSLFGALPFVFTGDIPNFIDALFETISGFTTTGASILADVESLSHANLFWRSFTHWIGGMGVFVFIMAILPMMGGSTMNLMRAESPGPSVSRLLPKVKDTAKILYLIYIGITLTQIVILFVCGMNLFDAVTLSFGTTGTGGFGTKNDSLAGYSPICQNVVTLFMIISGINYAVFFCILRKQFKDAFSIEEVRWYLIIILASVGLITWNIADMYPTVGESLRHAFFQVGSIITTTGYSTTDFDLWPQLSKNILVILMFIGACAGSTGGGIKVSRIVILCKAIRKELDIMIHPRMVKKIKMDGHVLPHETQRSTNVFITAYFILFFASMLLISLDDYSFTTNFTAVAATLNNIGPGLDLVGPTQNFGLFSPFSKCVLMFDMLAGRLELFPMLIILLPSCWKKY